MKKLIKGIVKSLEQHPLIELIDFYIGEGLSTSFIDELELKHNIVLDKKLRKFFEKVDGVYIEWTLNKQLAATQLDFKEPDDIEEIGGKINIADLHEILQGWKLKPGSNWETGFEDEKEVEELFRFCPFDKNLDETMTGFLREANTINNELYFIRQEEPLLNLGLTIKQYIKAMIQTKGYYGWHDALFAGPEGVKLFAMYDYLPQLFPNEKLSFFNSNKTSDK